MSKTAYEIHTSLFFSDFWLNGEETEDHEEGRHTKLREPGSCHLEEKSLIKDNCVGPFCE